MIFHGLAVGGWLGMTQSIRAPKPNAPVGNYSGE
jgi:hypothetical protein